MRIAPKYVDRYASPPTYEEAMKYASMPSMQTQSYPNSALQPSDNNGSHFPTNTPVHDQQTRPTFHRE